MYKRLTQILWRLLTTHAAWPVLLTVGLLCMVSLLSLDAAAGVGGVSRSALQMRHMCVGLVALVLILVIHYEWFGRLAYAFMAGVILLLCLVFFTEPINYSRRWFMLFGGLQLQPSELAKLAFVLSVAWYLRYRRNFRQVTGLIGPILLMLVPCVLILYEPDLGTALLFPLVLYVMLIASGARIQHLLLIAYVAIACLPLSYFFLRGYQQERVRTMYVQIFHHDNADVIQANRQGSGYQVYLSMVSIASGGTAGHDDQSADLIKRGMLPEAHTDFIFAVVGAKWGFWGAAGVVALYLAFLAAGMEIAASTRDPFGRLVVVGLVSLVSIEAIINISMTIGLIPVVGIALPFISYGGSSMVTNMVAVGLLLNISLRRRTKNSSLSKNFAAA